ncbi:MAG: amidohydrolase family protein [Burkholderiales bacterium]|nr:amidohydrolase family protein [Burkholderiales bacterium]
MTGRTDDYRGSFPRSSREAKAWHARAAAVTALEPRLPIVDAHHHLFGSLADTVHYPLEDLTRDLACGHRVLATVYVEAYESGWRTSGPEALRPVGEIDAIVALTRTPLPTPQGSCEVAAGIVGYADLTLGDEVADVLQAQKVAGEGRLRGVRHRAATDDGTVGRFIKDRPRPHLLLEPGFRRGFAHLERCGLSFDAWLYHTQLHELVDLADAFPNTIIVVDHVGAPMGVAEWRPKRLEVLAQWERDLRALAARPNVCVKIGGMGMVVFGFGFEHSDRAPTAVELARSWQPLIDVCIDAFGTHRCMFESNFPPDQQSCSYVELWNAFKLATRTLTDWERCDLFYRTACRTYRLPELERLGDALAAG